MCRRRGRAELVRVPATEAVAGVLERGAHIRIGNGPIVVVDQQDGEIAEHEGEGVAHGVAAVGVEHQAQRHLGAYRRARLRPDGERRLQITEYARLEIDTGSLIPKHLNIG